MNFLLKYIWVIYISFAFYLNANSKPTYSIDSLRQYEDQIRILRGSDSSEIDLYKQKIINITKQTSNNELLFHSYISLGNIERRENNFDNAINSYFQALSLSKHAESTLQIANIYDNLARIYMSKGETGLMFESINKSLSIRKEKDDQRGIHRTKQILSSYYRSKGNYAEVLRNVFNALNYFISISDTLQIAHSYNSIGITYKTLNNYEKALHYYRQSEIYFKSINNKKGISTILNNIGSIYLQEKNYQDALENFTKSLEIENSLGNTSHILTRYNNIGLAYTYLGNFSSARYYLGLCVESHTRSGSLIRLANSYESLAQYHEVLNNTDSVEFYLLKSYKLCEELGIKNLQANIALKLSQICYNRGNMDNAYKLLETHRMLKENVFSSNNIYRVTEEEFNYLKAKDIELTEAEEKGTLYKLISLSSALVILVLISIIIITIQVNKSRKEHKRSNKLHDEIKTQKEELHLQGKELLSKTLRLGNENSEISHAIQQLNKLKSEFGVHGKQKIQTVIQNLELSKNNDIWEEFEIRFSLVNSKFYDTLLSSYPTLTVNEKRLSALIYLNFSTKEIAKILKQTHRSVLVAKSRLRKKMNVPSDKELSNFLFDLVTP
jgi:tetratricopeptide (TPR) repeat protein